MIAPLHLVAVSVLGLAASLGLTTCVFQRITSRERRVLAHQLPRELRDPLKTADKSQRFSAREFLARAHARAGGNDMPEQEMRNHARAVLTTLQDATPDHLAYVRAQLSGDYDTLFRTAAPDHSCRTE